MFFVVIFQVHFKYQGKYSVIIGAWNPVNVNILLEYLKLGGEKKGKSKLLLYSLFSLFFWWRQYVRRFNDDTRSTMMDVLLNNKKRPGILFWRGAKRQSLLSLSGPNSLDITYTAQLHSVCIQIKFPTCRQNYLYSSN